MCNKIVITTQTPIVINLNLRVHVATDVPLRLWTPAAARSCRWPGCLQLQPGSGCLSEPPSAGSVWETPAWGQIKAPQLRWWGNLTKTVGQVAKQVGTKR